MLMGGVQGEIRDAVEVVPTVGVVLSDRCGTEWRFGTQFECVCAGGAIGLVRHLWLRSGGEGRSRGTDVQTR